MTDTLLTLILLMLILIFFQRGRLGRMLNERIDRALYWYGRRKHGKR